MFGFGQNDDYVQFTSDDDVYQLSDDNFDYGNDSPRLSPSSRVKPCGIIIAYSKGCGACKSKEDTIKALGNIVNTDNLSQCAIYVIDVDINNRFSEAVELVFVPSIYYVDESGKREQRDLDLKEELNSLL